MATRADNKITKPSYKAQGLKKYSIEDVEKVWASYKQWCIDNPRIKKELCQKTGEFVANNIRCPYSVEGFIVHAYEYYNHWDIGDYMYNIGGGYESYAVTFTRIRRSIQQDQFSGALTNEYNSNIVSRLNGLADKKEIETQSIKVKIEGLDADKV